MKIDLPQFGQLIRRAREDKGLSTQALARKVGSSATRINQIEKASPSEETGKIRRPSRELVLSLADHLHLDRNHLLLLTGHAPESEPVSKREAIPGPAGSPQQQKAALIFHGLSELPPEDQQDFEVTLDLVLRELERRKRKKN